MPTTDQNSPRPPEPAHPICPTCDVPMWMTKVKHFGSPDKPQHSDLRVIDLREQIYHATAKGCLSI